MVLGELDKYNDLKDRTYAKQSGLSGQEKKKLIEENAQALSAIQKQDKRQIMLLISLLSSTNHIRDIKNSIYCSYICYLTFYIKICHSVCAVLKSGFTAEPYVCVASVFYFYFLFQSE